MEQHVLVIFPHPDDETYHSGGTIAQFSREGVPVTLICATLGQMGRHMGKPFFATRESLPQVREAELVEACEILGIKKVIQLGLLDKTLAFEDHSALADRIVRIVREIRPTLVIVHYPGYSVHPDHNALGEVAITALSRLREEERPKVYAHAYPNAKKPPLGAADIVNDITDVAKIKMAAIRAHGSQSQGLLERLQNGKLNKKVTDDLNYRFLKRESFWVYKFK